MKNVITRWSEKGGSHHHFRFDHILFLFLFLFMAGLIIHLFDFYPLPTNDYIQFYKPATSILNWKPLESYKILPLYPSLIALVSLVVPNDPTLLKSMQIVIFLSSLGAMILFWRLSHRYLPRTWPIFLLVICLNPYFLEFSLQVFMEMLILAMVTLTIWMFVHDGKRVYISAGLTTLTRYDSIFLLPIISWLRFRRSGFKRLHLVLGAVAGSGILVWMILSMIHSSFINPYIGEYFSTSGHALIPLTQMLGRMLIGAPPSGANLSLPSLLLLIAFSMVIACGMFKFWNKEPDTTVTIVGFILTYFAIHAAFVAALYRYNFPILPFFFFFFFIAMERPASNGHNNHKVPFFISITVLILLSTWLITPLFQVSHVRVAWWFVLAFTTAFIIYEHSRHRLSILKSLMIWTAVALCMFPSLKTWESQYQLYRGMFSEYPAVLKWAEANCQDGQKVAMITPWILDARYPNSRVMKHLVDTGSISSDTVIDFLAECRSKGYIYLAWTTINRVWKQSTQWHHQTRGTLLDEMNLDVARSNPYCILVAILTTAPGRHAYIFRIRTPRDYVPDALRIDPNREASARPLLQEGWSQTFEGRPGDRYIWATGKYSSLIFQMKHPPKQAILAFSALPFIGPGLPSQQLEIKINGQSLAAVTLLDHEKEYQIPVNGKYLVRGVNQVTFRYTYCAAPSQLGTGPDERQLAVLFKGISLLPSSK